MYFNFKVKIKTCLNINREFWKFYLFILSWESVSSSFDFKDHLKSITSLKSVPSCLASVCRLHESHSLLFILTVMIQAWIPEIILLCLFGHRRAGPVLNHGRHRARQKEEEEAIKPDFKKEVSSFEKSHEVPLALRRERITTKKSDGFFVMRKPVLQVSDPLKRLTEYSPHLMADGDPRDTRNGQAFLLWLADIAAFLRMTTLNLFTADIAKVQYLPALKKEPSEITKNNGFTIADKGEIAKGQESRNWTGLNLPFM